VSFGLVYRVYVKLIDHIVVKFNIDPIYQAKAHGLGFYKSVNIF